MKLNSTTLIEIALYNIMVEKAAMLDLLQLHLDCTASSSKIIIISRYSLNITKTKSHYFQKFVHFFRDFISCNHKILFLSRGCVCDFHNSFGIISIRF